MAKQKPTNEHKSSGRPSSFKEEYCEQAYKMCLLGATDKQLAGFFEVAESTLNLWKKEQPEFSESLKKGKSVADSKVAESLYNRAVGCRITVQQAHKIRNIYYENGKKAREVEEIKIVDLIMEQPPDTTACIFWLKNRQPDRWRDKRDIAIDSNEEIKEAYLAALKNMGEGKCQSSGKTRNMGKKQEIS